MVFPRHGVVKKFLLQERGHGHICERKMQILYETPFAGIGRRTLVRYCMDTVQLAEIMDTSVSGKKHDIDRWTCIHVQLCM